MNYLKILGFVATYLCLCGATPVLAADSLPIAKVDAHQHEKSASALSVRVAKARLEAGLFHWWRWRQPRECPPEWRLPFPAQWP